ncbi:MAG: hypothetical protein RR310_03505 [Eubacterium sp.]
MEEKKNPLMVVGVKGEQYVYKTEEALSYSNYREIKNIAENITLYESNARCVNPDVLAFQFLQRVKDELNIHLKQVESWPQMVIKLKNK